MAGRPKKEIGLKELLQYRMENNNPSEKHKGKSLEYNFSNKLNNELEDILNELGYKTKKITKEFKLLKGICDFLCELENNEFLIIECKISSNEKYENNDLKFSFAIGQLLSYRTSLSLLYEIPKERIKLMLITDKDSLFTLSVIASEELNIDYLVYNDGGAKYYGCK